MTHGSARSERDGWMDDNTRGLSLAAAAEWDEATEAFAAAADVLARRAPDSTSHDALGLILANLAQACFRAGRTREALAHAQRACSIRVALAGEDAMPVCRARMDLAVMLGSVGRIDEAQALMQRAILSMERHVGDEDVRLVVMLENAARLALASGSPANAEPLLLRLHALLDVHGLPTARADRLLAMVASVRARRPSIATAVYAHTADEWDDQPLRDAVALTDVLLRTTPSGVIAIAETVNHDAEILAAFEHVVHTPTEPMLELVDETPSSASDIILDLADDFGGADLLVDFEVTEALVAERVEAVEPAAAPAPEPRAEPLSALNAPLRPVVRHIEPIAPYGFGPPPAAVVQPSENSFDSAADNASDLTVRRATPSHASVVMPTAADTERSGAPKAGDHTAPAPRPRRAPLSNRRDSSGSGGKRRLIMGGAAALAAAGAAAWYFLLR